MENSDSEQSGLVLPPQIATRLIAEAAARQVVMEHIRLCPFAGSKIDERVRTLETNFARLLGFMLGSGIIGGATAASLTKLFMP